MKDHKNFINGKISYPSFSYIISESNHIKKKFNVFNYSFIFIEFMTDIFTELWILEKSIILSAPVIVVLY